jgi:short-subunit dehydrogenase
MCSIMQLEGTTVVLTGASGGIGQALAGTLAEAGARLVLAGRDGARLDRLVDALPHGSVLEVCIGDLTNGSARDRLAAAALEHDCAVLINVCGGNRFGLLDDQSDVDVDALLAINLAAPIQLTRRLLGHLRSRESAMVVNIGSAYGAIGYPGYAIYCASKFGLRGFSEAIGRELADTSVRVLHVAPRATRTAMNSRAVEAMNEALGNAADEPGRVARRIVKAIRSNERRVAIGWPERFFARLDQALPGIVDRALGQQLQTIKRFAALGEQEESPS